MASRLDLQTLLEGILGSNNVYFQPPASVQIRYPAIVYEFADYSVWNANDGKYILQKAYTVTFIHKDPDNQITDAIHQLPYCDFDRRMTTDNLYHDIFTLYF